MPQSLSRADDDDQDDTKDKVTLLKDELLRKLADMDLYNDPKMADIFLKELEGVLDDELPKDPEAREDILKSMYEELGQGQKEGLGEGPRGGYDPFAPFEEVPFPR